MLPTTFFIVGEQNASMENQTDLPLILLVVFVASMGLFVGAIFGFAQWNVLRCFARKAWLWIIGNSIGWAVALIWIFFVASIPGDETSLTIILVLGAIGGLFSELSVGIITRIFLLRIVHHKKPEN